jgi:aminoglycoside 3-N-acetyltransferase
MVHASWRPLSGFRGKPADMVRALQESVGPQGLLAMPSLTYQNQSSREFLALGKPMDVRRSVSQMGLLSEVFRRSREVRRSLSPTHPILAWGEGADAFLAGHQRCEVPFGRGSPFDGLLARGGKILCIDAPFSTVTFTHYLEDRIAGSLSFSLYDPGPMIGTVVDYEGVRYPVPTRVISEQANRLRREERLVAELDRAGLMRRGRVGNTRLLLLEARAMTECVERMVAAGRGFFDLTTEQGGPAA